MIAPSRPRRTTDLLAVTPEVVVAVRAGLEARGIAVEELRLDAAEVRRYVKRAGYTTRYPDYYSGNRAEKTLEHYIAARLLDLAPEDVYIDVASERSPVPEIYRDLFGCTAYRQDLSYPAGVHRDRIGGDAAAMPLPAAWASAMALHCSFEHFEGDVDIRFLREAARVLRPGGRVCIVPLYLHSHYAFLTDPAAPGSESVAFDDDALVHVMPGWGNRHGRFYDPDHFDTRVRRNLGDLRLRLFHVVNADEMDPGCYVRFAALLRKPER